MDAIFWNFSPSFSSRKPTESVISRYIGCYKIAHWIRKQGYQAQVIDYLMSMDYEKLYLVTKKFITDRTLILGISTTFMCTRHHLWNDGTHRIMPEFLIQVLQALKQEYPKLKVIVGGYAADYVPGFGVIDASVMSYTSATEDIFLEYLDHCRSGSALPLGSLTAIRDSRSQDDVAQIKPRMCYNQARSPKYNIELDDFRFVEQDVILPNEALPLDISRGCIFACRFCNYPHLGKKKLDYVRGMEYIKSELNYNYETFGIRNYQLLDDTFNDTEWKISEFAKIVNSLPFKINYSCYLRADLLERFSDVPYQLAESGLAGAFFGLESLHPYASNLVGKAWSGRKARDYVPHLSHNIWKNQVVVQLAMIIGLPKETEADLISTFNWFEQNNLHHARVGVLSMIKNPGSSASEFEKQPEKYGFTFDHLGRWVNETWTYTEAITAKNMLDQKYRAIGITGSWFATGLLALGYSKEKIFATKNRELRKVFNIETHAKENADVYYHRLMNL
jgi:radical SAM superfamily enzyme YgiQ (UPF0313 family)